MSVRKGGKERQSVRVKGQGEKRVAVPVSPPVALFLFSV